MNLGKMSDHELEIHKMWTDEILSKNCNSLFEVIEWIAIMRQWCLIYQDSQFIVKFHSESYAPGDEGPNLHDYTMKIYKIMKTPKSFWFLKWESVVKHPILEFCTNTDRQYHNQKPIINYLKENCEDELTELYQRILLDFKGRTGKEWGTAKKLVEV